MKIHIGTPSTGLGHLVDLSQQLARMTATVQEQKHKALFITVSPNPKTRHDVIRNVSKTSIKSKKVKFAYSVLTHSEQYNVLDMYLSKVYLDVMEHGDWAYIVYEINKSNNLHAHMILYSSSIQSQYDLKALQKTVYCHPLTLYNMDKKSKIDYMNNIVYIDDDKMTEVRDYVAKDQDIKERFPDRLKVF